MPVPEMETENPFKVRRARKVSLSSFSDKSASSTPTSSRSASPSPASFSLPVQRDDKDSKDRNGNFAFNELSAEKNFVAQLEDLTRQFEEATATCESTVSQNISTTVSYEEYWRQEVEVEGAINKTTATPLDNDSFCEDYFRQISKDIEEELDSCKSKAATSSRQDNSRSKGSISSLLSGRSSSSSSVDDESSSRTLQFPSFKPYTPEQSTESSTLSVRYKESTSVSDTEDSEYSKSTKISPKYKPFKFEQDLSPSYSSSKYEHSTAPTDKIGKDASLSSDLLKTHSLSSSRSAIEHLLQSYSSSKYTHTASGTENRTKGYNIPPGPVKSRSLSSSPVPHSFIDHSTSSELFSSYTNDHSRSEADMAERGRIYAKSQPSSRSSSPGLFSIRPAGAVTIFYTSVKTTPEERTNNHKKVVRIVDIDTGRKQQSKSAEDLRRELLERRKNEEQNLLAQEGKESAFQIEQIDFHLEENKRNHHTDEYEKEELVIRRGQTFTLTVILKSTTSFDPQRDAVLLSFEIGDNPVESNGTRIDPKMVTSFKDVKGWAIQMLHYTENSVKFEVMASPAAIVGKYYLTVKTKIEVEGTDIKWVHHDSKPLYVLFNAWCEDDAVYLVGEEERKEYVLNENGQIWKNKNLQAKGLEWYFGQFEDVSLDCALFLLHNLSMRRTSTLSDPVVVTRALSALINNKEVGVVKDFWSGEYDNGKHPSSWNGSVRILEEFMVLKQAVKYGQCWVFAALLTTLGRALGIPTRCVTGIRSAHDNDGSTVIHKFFNAVTNKLMPDRSDHRVWNFHVWNECWFKRPDLLTGYDGWQSLDSTPHELCAGRKFDEVLSCGPAPVRAIKEGNRGISYDTAFLFGEVHSDVSYWSVEPEGSETFEWMERDIAGKYIITKKLGDKERMPYGVDIKSEYKKVGEKAQAVLFGNTRQFSRGAQDIVFNHSLPSNAVIGEDASFKLFMKNLSSEDHSVSVTININSVYYTGVTNPKICKAREVIVVVPANSEKSVILHLSVEDYVGCMVDDKCIFRVFFQADVSRTNQIYIAEEDYVFDVPELTVKCPDKVESNTPFQVLVSFTNRLPCELHGGVLNVEGRYIRRQSITHATVPAYGEVSAEIQVDCKPSRTKTPRKFLLHVSFTSKLFSLKNTAWIDIIS